MVNKSGKTQKKICGAEPCVLFEGTLGESYSIKPDLGELVNKITFNISQIKSNNTLELQILDKKTKKVVLIENVDVIDFGWKSKKDWKREETSQSIVSYSLLNSIPKSEYIVRARSKETVCDETEITVSKGNASFDLSCRERKTPGTFSSETDHAWVSESISTVYEIANSYSLCQFLDKNSDYLEGKLNGDKLLVYSCILKDNSFKD